jgi:hypothetical protein
MPTSTTTSTAPAAISGRRGDDSARITWTAPSSGAGTITSYVIAQELWAPSMGAWHSPVYRSMPASQLATTVTALDNGRRYRFRVLAHNSVGNSAWTPYVEVVPATVPDVPATDRGLSASFDEIRFAWWKAGENGTPVTSYTVAIRRKTATGYTSWSYTTVAAGVFSYKFGGLRSGATYQVTVKANSSTGSSRYGTYRSITTALR